MPLSAKKYNKFSLRLLCLADWLPFSQKDPFLKGTFCTLPQWDLLRFFWEKVGQSSSICRKKSRFFFLCIQKEKWKLLYFPLQRSIVNLEVLMKKLCTWTPIKIRQRKTIPHWNFNAYQTSYLSTLFLASKCKHVASKLSICPDCFIGSSAYSFLVIYHSHA